jgi:hypothetical protein
MVVQVETEMLEEILPANPVMVVEAPAVLRPELCLESASHQISVALHLSMAAAAMEQMVLEAARHETMRVKRMQSH